MRYKVYKVGQYNFVGEQSEWLATFQTVEYAVLFAAKVGGCRIIDGLTNESVWG
jgi:hypothetical protein